MKRLLSFLGAATICSSAVTALGLQYANKEQSSVLKKIQNYIDVSSLLARATILSQNPTADNVTTGGQGFSRNYASQYIDNRPIGDFFPNPERIRGAAKNTRSRILLGSMFNYPADNNPFIPNLVDSNLSLNDPSVGKTGDSDLVKTLGLVSGVLQLLLGSDFNEGLAATINGLLESGAIDNVGNSIKGSIPQIGTIYLKNPATGAWIFDEFAQIWNEDDLTAAYPGRDFTSLKFSEVFQVRQNDFWKGIARILYSGYGSGWTSVDSAVESANTPLDKAKAAIDTQNADFKLELNGLLIEGIGYLIRYLRTLGVFYDRILSQAIPIEQIRDREHLFSNLNSPESVNSIWLGQRMEDLYANPDNIVFAGDTIKKNISIWSQEVVGSELKYYQLINVQALVQFLTKIFVVDQEKDPNSFITQQALAMLLFVPLQTGDKDSKAVNIDNPLADTVLSPLLGTIAAKLVKKIPDVGGLLSGVDGLIQQIFGFFRTMLSDSKPLWDIYPLTNDASVRAIFPPIVIIKKSDADYPYSFAKYLTVLATQLRDNINKIPIGITPEIKAAVQKIYDAIIRFTNEIEEERNSTGPKETFGNPLKSLMSGNLLDKIYNLIDSTELVKIPEFVRTKIPNVNTLLTSKLGELFGAFGLAVADWPIYLYGLKDKSISEVVATIGDRFDTKRYLNLDQNQSYLLNTRAVERLIIPLDDQVTMTFKNGIPTELQPLFNGNDTNAVVAALIALAYRADIASVTVDGTTVTKSFLSYILGIQKTGDVYTYRPNSLFYGLEQLYGHKNTEEPPALLRATRLTVQKIISNFSALVNWMQNTSIPEYVNDFFTPYFVKGWSTRYLSSANLSNPNMAAFIEYNLVYTLDKNPPITYKVRLERDSWIPNNEQPWFNYGIWRLHSINRLT